MPGFSEACVSGAHQACLDSSGECRCQCHATTQQLEEKARRQQTQIRSVEPSPELSNTCPKCGARQKATDQFCRADGSRLMLGKRCLACGSPGDTSDVFCWNCGTEHGTLPAKEQAESLPTEDRIAIVRKKAVELGLLKETVV